MYQQARRTFIREAIGHERGLQLCNPLARVILPLVMQ